MLLCDGCDVGFHTFCLEPKLPNIPRSAPNSGYSEVNMLSLWYKSVNFSAETTPGSQIQTRNTDPETRDPKTRDTKPDTRKGFLTFCLEPKLPNIPRSAPYPLLRNSDTRKPEIRNLLPEI